MFMLLRNVLGKTNVSSNSTKKHLKISFPGWQFVPLERTECKIWHPDSLVALAVASEAGGATGLPQKRNQERAEGDNLLQTYFAKRILVVSLFSFFLVHQLNVTVIYHCCLLKMSRNQKTFITQREQITREQHNFSDYWTAFSAWSESGSSFMCLIQRFYA